MPFCYSCCVIVEPQSEAMRWYSFWGIAKGHQQKEKDVEILERGMGRTGEN
jgi:hypothetical protein